MDYDSSIYGDAVYETSYNAYRYNGSSWEGEDKGSWYGDYSYLSYISYPWITRGGYNSSAGVFPFHINSGYAHVNTSFRPVVTSKSF